MSKRNTTLSDAFEIVSGAMPHIFIWPFHLVTALPSGNTDSNGSIIINIAKRVISGFGGLLFFTAYLMYILFLSWPIFLLCALVCFILLVLDLLILILTGKRWYVGKNIQQWAGVYGCSACGGSDRNLSLTSGPKKDYLYECRCASCYSRGMWIFALLGSE